MWGGLMFSWEEIAGETPVRADRPLSPSVHGTLEPVVRDGRQRYEVSRSTRPETRLTARATAR